MNHEVYVIYRDGEPFKGKRAAYYTKRDANSAITGYVKGACWRDGSKEKLAQERQRYTAVPYIAKEASE